MSRPQAARRQNAWRVSRGRRTGSYHNRVEGCGQPELRHNADVNGLVEPAGALLEDKIPHVFEDTHDRIRPSISSFDKFRPASESAKPRWIMT